MTEVDYITSEVNDILTANPMMVLNRFLKRIASGTVLTCEKHKLALVVRSFALRIHTIKKMIRDDASEYYDNLHKWGINNLDYLKSERAEASSIYHSAECTCS
jgi:hypothetical protein